MHSATDFIKIGASAIKNMAIQNDIENIIFIAENGSDFEKIAEELCKENMLKVNLLVL